MANSEFDAAPSTATNPFGGTVVGGALAAVLADASDATYFQMDAGFMQLDVSVWTNSVPAGSQVRYVDFVIRHDYHPANTQPYYSVYLAGYLAQNVLLPEPPGTGLGDVVIGPFSTDGNGNAITVGSISNIVLDVFKNGASVIKLAKVTMRVFYNAKPTTPTVDMDLDDLTTVSVTYADPELDPLEAIQVAIFTDAVKTGGGFDPATSTAVYRSGTTYVSVVSGSTVIHATNQRILTAGTYWAYARVSDAGSAGRWSDWGNDSTVQVVDAPSPVIIATDDTANGCVVVRVLGQFNQAQDDSFEVAATVNVTGATKSRSTDHAADGTWSLKTVVDVGSNNLQVDPTVATYDLDLGYGVPWVYAVSIWPVGAGKSAYVSTSWNDTVGHSGIINTAPVATPLPAGQFTRIVLPGAPTPGVDSRLFGWTVQVLPESPGDTVYFDKLSFHPGTADNYSARQPNRLFSGFTKWALQRSDDGGVTWTDVARLYNVPERGGALADRLFMTNAGTNNTQIALVRDFEAPRGKSVQYRARVYEDGNPTAPGGSPWGATATIATDSGRSTWLKDPTNPANNWHGYVDGHIKASQKETQEIHEILDATRPVVVTGPILGDALGGRFLALTDAKRDAIRALRALQRTLLLQARDGRQWYCRLGPLLDVEPTDDLDPVTWAMDFQAIEVAAP